MSPARNPTREVQCPGCGGWFRIESRRGRSLPSAVPCPRCEARIPVERPSSEQFWVSTSHSEIFERRPARGAEERDEEADAARDTSTLGEETSAGRIDRAFRDVSEVRGPDDSVLPGANPSGAVPDSPERAESESAPLGMPDDRGSDDERDVGDEESGEGDLEASLGPRAPEPGGEEAPFGEIERAPPNADLEMDEQGLEFVSADSVEDSAATPLPVSAHEETSADEDESVQWDEAAVDDADPEVAAEVEEQSEVQFAEEEGDGGQEPRPAAELATIPFADWEREWTADVDAPRYEVRVHDTVREEVSIRDVVGLLEEGVWAGAVDVRDEQGEWVPLPKHPAFERLRSHLVDQSQQILLRRGRGVDESAESGTSESGVSSVEPDAAPPVEEERDEPQDAPAEPEKPPPVPEVERGDEESEGRPPETPVGDEEVETTDTTDAEDEAAAEPESVPAESEAGRRRSVAVGVAAAWVLGTIVAAVLLLNDQASESPTEPNSGMAAQTAGETGVQADVGRRAEPGPTPASASEAVAAARTTVGDALSPKQRARGYLEGKAPKAARQLAIRAMADEGVSSELRAILNESIRRDESLAPTPVTIGVDAEVDAIHALGGGWSLSFRMTEGGESVYAFKPAQKEWERGWRAEIAAYHLCEVITCHFDIPRNRPARIRKSRFMRLYGRVGGELQRDYRDRFDQLVWRTEEGPDGRMHEYLYGTLKDWVPDFVKFPIEYETVWRPWLSGENSAEILDRPFPKALAPLKKKGKADFYESILEEKADATTRSVAKQLSSILVFDFLTTNWDRFSTAEKFYGVNNQFANGQFISIDNGAAFSPHHFRVVTRRLAPVTRYSATTVASIRALEPSVVNPILFPNPTSGERRRLAIFWEQRDKLIDRVNGLIVEHGRDEVLAFE